MKEIGIVTGTRADYGIYFPVLKAIEASPDLTLRIMACGAHLSEKYGYTADVIVNDGFKISEKLETLEEVDNPCGIALSIGRGVKEFAKSFSKNTPDLLLVLGDRYEMFAAAIAAMPFILPIAHIHGGEATEGLIDEAIRHSITKMSHFHFVSTQAYANRVIQMGENPETVYVTGAPSLDNIKNIKLMTKSELELDLDLVFFERPIIVTYHPVTLEFTETAWQIEQLLIALTKINRPIIITYPNADTSGSLIIETVDKFAESNQNIRAFSNLGTRRYFSLMAIADAMAGNSSSGILEAASFRLPVVNIGNRQKGRVRNENVIDVGYSEKEISNGLAKALSSDFKAKMGSIKNLYGDGQAAERIVNILAGAKIDTSVVQKSFYDLEFIID
jgi:UDP-hydrolysing UDP-N-acetyl-D-glucosamine 2-epimerase